MARLSGPTCGRVSSGPLAKDIFWGSSFSTRGLGTSSVSTMWKLVFQVIPIRGHQGATRRKALGSLREPMGAELARVVQATVLWGPCNCEPGAPPPSTQTPAVRHPDPGPELMGPPRTLTYMRPNSPSALTLPPGTRACDRSARLAFFCS